MKLHKRLDATSMLRVASLVRPVRALLLTIETIRKTNILHNDSKTLSAIKSSWNLKKAVRRKRKQKRSISSFDANTLPHFTSIMNNRPGEISLGKQKSPRPKQDEDLKSRYTTYSVLRHIAIYTSFL